MRIRSAAEWRLVLRSPRFGSALRGALVGASLSLVLVAGPLLLLSGGGNQIGAESGAPLAALATLPSDPGHFDLADILDGAWVGEMCPDDGEPVPVSFEFIHETDDSVSYSLAVAGNAPVEGMIGNGGCFIEGEDISFHAFLAVLTDCKEACGVDRVYEGHFEEGALVGVYNDGVVDEACRSCIGAGTWWLEPDA